MDPEGQLYLPPLLLFLLTYTSLFLYLGKDTQPQDPKTSLEFLVY